MNFEPQKFFVGLMDFFSILLPGALLTYLLADQVGPVVLGDRYGRLDGAEAGAVFLFASYLVGHLVFLFGSFLDELYDWLRFYTLNHQIERIARDGQIARRRMLWWPARAFIWLVFKRERDVAVKCAERIKRKALGDRAESAINTFQWCKAWLSAESPDALAAVQRFEADSKFFRCFAVVLIVLLVAWLWPESSLWPTLERGMGLAILLGLLLAALFRYMEQRNKSTNQAYWSVIARAVKAGSSEAAEAGSAPAAPAYAGGIVYRRRRRLWSRESDVEFLLVESKEKDDPTKWTLPVVRLEDGETHRAAAIRGVLQETGVWAHISDPKSHDVLSLQDGKSAVVRFLPMQVLSRWGARKDRLRKSTWRAESEMAVGVFGEDLAKVIKAFAEGRQRPTAEDLVGSGPGTGGGTP
jgi:hypothetical protein